MSWFWACVLKGHMEVGQGQPFGDYALAECIRNWDSEQPVREGALEGAGGCGDEQRNHG